MARIQLKRGLKSALPASGMLPGEPHATTDRGTLHVAVDPTTRIPVVPPIDDLAALPAIDGANDLMMVHDASEASAQKEKKLTCATLVSLLKLVSSDDVAEIVALTQAEYDALAPPDANTLYLITG